MYQLGFDLGTTRSAAAVHRAGGTRVEPPVPTAVYAAADGSFAVGEEARARALSHPARVVTGFVDRVGDPTPLLLGREPVTAEALAARFVGRVVEPVLAREGGAPAVVAVAHPSGWGRHRIESLRTALGGRAALVPQAVAAVIGHGGERAPGALVAVHDLGGTGFTASVVRIVPGGAELAGAAETVEHLGGDDVDDAVFAHVRESLGAAWTELDGTDPAVQAAVVALRRACTGAKERLSADTEVAVPVRLPGLAPTEVRLTRAELEEAIRPAVLRTVEAMTAALDAAGVAPADLADVLLVGGSARIPLVAQLVSAGLGRAVTVADDPKGVVAAGAAVWAARRVAGAGAGPGSGAGAAVGAAGAGGGTSAAVGAGAAVAGAGPAAGGPVDGPDRAQEVAGEADAAARAVDRESLRAAVARPPKQPRAFPTEAAPESRLPLFVGIGVLVLTILGALVVVGASRYAAENAAVATTPTTVAPAGQQGAPPTGTSDPPQQQVAPTRRPAAPPPTTTTPAPTTTTAPPPTTPPAEQPGGVGGGQDAGDGDGDEGAGDGNGDVGGDGGGEGAGGGEDPADDAPPAGNGAAGGDDGAQQLADPSAVEEPAP